MFNPFDNLSKEELLGRLKPSNMPEPEFMMMLEAMRAKGLPGTIMAVDDLSGPDGLAAKEYIDYHQKIDPSYFDHMPEHEIDWAKQILFQPDIAVEDKKRALIILAHVGRPDVFEVLAKFEKNPD